MQQIFFKNVYLEIGIVEESVQFAIQMVIIFSIVSLLFRIILTMLYQNMYSFYKIQAKQINTKEDIKGIKFWVFSKAVANFIAAKEKGAVSLTSLDIVKQEVLKANFLFLSRSSIGEAVEFFEKNIVMVCFLLAVVFNMNVYLAFLGIILFGIFVIAKMLFNFSILREKLINDMAYFIEIQIGQFYPKDTVSAVIELGRNLNSVFDLSVEKMLGFVNTAMLNIGKSSEVLNEPIEKWRSLVAEASNSQAELNEKIKGINETFKNIKSGDEIDSKMELIKINQNLLENSVSVFEQTLKEITLDIGDGFGKIVDYQMQKTYDNINSQLNENFKKLREENTEFIRGLKDVLIDKGRS